MRLRTGMRPHLFLSVSFIFQLASYKPNFSTPTRIIYRRCICDKLLQLLPVVIKGIFRIIWAWKSHRFILIGLSHSLCIFWFCLLSPTPQPNIFNFSIFFPTSLPFFLFRPTQHPGATCFSLCTFSLAKVVSTVGVNQPYFSKQYLHFLFYWVMHPVVSLSYPAFTFCIITV